MIVDNIGFGNDLAIDNIRLADINYSVEKTGNNKPVAVSDRDILKGIPQDQWKQIVKLNLKEKFPKGVEINKNQININSDSRRELTYSEYTKGLAFKNSQIYSDKMRITDNADDVLKASGNYINEEVKHKDNKPNISSIGCGTVLLQVGKNKYSAEVLVENAKDGRMILYDIVNIKPAQFDIKNNDVGNAVKSPFGNNIPSDETRVSNITKDIIPQKNEDVKNNIKYSLDVDENSLTPERLNEIRAKFDKDRACIIL